MAEHDRAKSIFLNAIENYAPDQWQAYLDGACGEDSHLHAKLTDLLNAHRDLGSIPKAQGTDTRNLDEASECVGMEIGPYKLLQEIGEGGFGVVYMAEQQHPVQRRVAIKIIKPGMGSREVIARFEAERQALAIMDHPNIARVLDAGSTESGSPYFVMELVRGVSITNYCDQNHLPPRERMRLFETVCQAVQHAHQKGVIHRDIKPSNVMITLHDGSPVVKVIDFGIAKAINQKLTDKTLFTKYAEMVGTPLYMSPEQAELSGLDIDTRADIYSLAVLLYELLTGTTPFDRQRFHQAACDEIRRVIREEDPPKPSTKVSTLGNQAKAAAANRQTEPKQLSALLRGELDWIVMKGLEKDRSRRYETASEFANDIERFLNNEPVEACPPSRLYLLQKFVRRNRPAIVAGAVLAIVLTLSAALSTWQAVRATSALHDAVLARQSEAEQKTKAQQAERRAAAEAARAHNATKKEHDLRIDAERLQSLAEENANRRRRALVQRYVDTGLRLMENSQFAEATPYLVEALRIDDDTHERIHRLRLKAALQWCPKIVQCWDVGMRAGGVDISPDGRFVVTYNSNSPYFEPPVSGQARLWELATGKLIAEMSHEKTVTCARFSPDGRFLATASADHTARLWHVESGRPATSPLKHDYAVLHVAFSPDSNHIVTSSSSSVTVSRSLRALAASGHGEARVWNVENGGLHHALHQGSPVRFSTFSQDGRTVATAGGDATVRLWSLDDGSLIGKPLRHSGPVARIAFRSDGRGLVTGVFPRGSSEVELWSWKFTDDATNPTGRKIAPLRMIAASQDGQYVAGDKMKHDELAGIFAWDVDDEQQTGVSIKHDHPYIWDAAFSRDGSMLVTASADRSARVWEMPEGRMLTTPLIHNSSVFTARFTPNARHVITLDTDGLLRQWDLAAACGPQEAVETGARPGRKIAIPRGLVRPDDVSVAMSGIPSRVWDLKTARPQTPFLTGFREAISIAMSQDGNLVAVADTSNSVSVYDMETNEIRFDLQGVGNTCIALSRDGRRLATGGREKVARIWNARTGELLNELPHENPRITTVAFSHDGRRIATAAGHTDRLGAPGLVRVWDTNTGESLTEPLPHPSHVIHIDFSPSGESIVTACYDGNLRARFARLWNIETGEPIGQPLQHKDGVFMAAYSPDGRFVATASEDCSARVWSAEDGSPLGAAMQHSHWVYSAVYSTDGDLIVTASRDKTARVWDAHTGRAITPPLHHGDYVRSAAFLNGDQSLVTICEDGTAVVWPLLEATGTPANLTDLSRVLAGKQFDEYGSMTPVPSGEFAALWNSTKSTLPEHFQAIASEDLAWHRHQARSAEKRNDWSSALEHLEFLVRRKPSNCQLPLRSAHANSLLKLWPQAVDDYTQALRLGADHWWIWFRRARAYGEQQRYQEAINDYLEAIQGNDYVGYRRTFEDVQRSDWEAAREHCTVAIADKPSYAAAWYCRGMIARQLREPDEAISDLGKAIELGIEDWRVSYFRARLNLENNAFPDAVTDATRVIEMDSSEQGRVWMLYNRARAHWSLGMHAEAIADLETRFKMRPNNTSGLNLLAWYLSTCPDAKLRKADRAVELAKSALRVERNSPNSMIYQNTLGVALYRAGQWEEAIDELTNVVAAGGTGFDYFVLAMAHWQCNQQKEAIEWYRKGLQWAKSNQQQEEQELMRFRTEAATLLEISEPTEQ